MIADLVKAMNDADLRAFPQKDNPKRLTISAEEEGVRYFISRMSIGQNEDGTAKYGWVKGKAWKQDSK